MPQVRTRWARSVRGRAPENLQGDVSMTLEQYIWLMHRVRVVWVPEHEEQEPPF